MHHCSHWVWIQQISLKGIGFLKTAAFISWHFAGGRFELSFSPGYATTRACSASRSPPVPFSPTALGGSGFWQQSLTLSWFSSTASEISNTIHSTWISKSISLLMLTTKSLRLKNEIWKPFAREPWTGGGYLGIRMTHNMPRWLEWQAWSASTYLK